MYALQSLRFTLIRHLTSIWEGVGQESAVFQNAPAFNAGAPGVEGVGVLQQELHSSKVPLLSLSVTASLTLTVCL